MRAGACAGAGRDADIDIAGACAGAGRDADIDTGAGAASSSLSTTSSNEPFKFAKIFPTQSELGLGTSSIDEDLARPITRRRTSPTFKPALGRRVRVWVCIDVSARARHAALHGCERCVNVCEVYFGDWCVVRMRTTSATDPS